ncbi:hypothetical protein CROQUDRAFT_658181 [Cronartium quercuum f. sp. fusiforme G11]|uniref:Uncharacterized protein n=1 Tax=Cronartium quercuum f. sp. fusiforme G11 TaxID=708437 RepID=A0A9P6NFA4_9BASI|nr:hypothetical protein CROQUDRAFT_658181 [Cronartium quercuum f. sp. fusiforme G11]
MEKLRPISGKGLRELPVSRSSEGSGHEVPSSFGRSEAPPETVRRSSEDWGVRSSYAASPEIRVRN